jgi:NAD(P)-dependent dehydrogenase (short-subunit alcohol dehydrogenase family)
VRAIVTGAARGLGQAIAARLAADGASVVLVDISPDVIGTARVLAGAGPGGAAGLVADVSDETVCEDMISQAAAHLGGVDLLVNNAGIGGPDTAVVDTAVADFCRVLEVNLGGTFLASRAVARLMIAQGTGGAIVNLGSIFGQQGVAGGAGYCASKAGIALLTQSLALELAPDRIRVNTIAPGNMATQMHWEELRSRAAAAGTSFDEQVSLVRAGVPLGRHGTGADIAGVVAWLASSDAGYVTGQTIGVNGGVWLS